MAVHRGNKLWEGSRMLLPEHREELLKANVEYYDPRILDEQELETFNERLHLAMENRCPVEIGYVTQAGRGIQLQKCKGYVHSLLPERGALTLKLQSGERRMIPIRNIQVFQLLEEEDFCVEE